MVGALCEAEDALWRFRVLWAVTAPRWPHHLGLWALCALCLSVPPCLSVPSSLCARSPVALLTLSLDLGRILKRMPYLNRSRRCRLFHFLAQSIPTCPKNKSRIWCNLVQFSHIGHGMSLPFPALWQWGIWHKACQPVEIVGNIFSLCASLFENITCPLCVVWYLVHGYE